MTLDRSLTRRDLARPADEVARRLLGCVLERRVGRTLLAARIVETEAYDEADPGSHSFRGMTPRNAVMFGPAGHLYVYFVYGMHWCVNVVTGPAGEGSAVLLRAAEPLEGITLMRRRRGIADVRRLCRGPANLARAFGLDGAMNGADIVAGGELRIARGWAADAAVVTDRRIGLREGRELRRRFLIADDPWVSRGLTATRRRSR